MSLLYKLLLLTLLILHIPTVDCKAQDVESAKLTAYLESEEWRKSLVRIPDTPTISYDDKSIQLHIDYITYIKEITSLIIDHSFSTGKETDPEMIAKLFLDRYAIKSGTTEYHKLSDGTYLWKSDGMVDGVEDAKWVTRVGKRVAYLKRNGNDIKILIGLFENADSADVERVMINSFKAWKE